MGKAAFFIMFRNESEYEKAIFIISKIIGLLLDFQ